VGQGEAGKARGPVNRCFVCGAENPRWLKSVDQGPQDYIWRKFHGTPGPTSKAIYACDEHKQALDSDFPPDP
jgi:hypothetical protein